MAARALWIVFVIIHLYVDKTGAFNIGKCSFINNILSVHFGLLELIGYMQVLGAVQEKRDSLYGDIQIDLEDYDGYDRRGWPYDKSNVFHPVQSPIDLITSLAVTKDLPFLHIIEPDRQKNIRAKFYNTGHNVYLKFEEAAEFRPYIVGGPLPEKFIFEQMHFHWGTKDVWGSEHFLDGESFSAEIHLVYFNSKYSDFKTACDADDGLAVLAIFAEATYNTNPLLEPLHMHMSSVTSASSSVLLNSCDAMQWASSALSLSSEYYTYPGSLTTEPFSENVIFIVLPEPITLSHDQLAAFRSIENRNHVHVTDNKRKLHPLNHRPIIHSANLQ